MEVDALACVFVHKRFLLWQHRLVPLAVDSNLKNFICTPRTSPIVPPQRIQHSTEDCSWPYRAPPCTFWGSSCTVTLPGSLVSVLYVPTRFWVLTTPNAFRGAEGWKLLPTVSTSVLPQWSFFHLSVLQYLLTCSITFYCWNNWCAFGFPNWSLVISVTKDKLEHL